VVKQYRLVRQLGRGGMGEVYLAEDTSLRRFVALKFIAGDRDENTDHRSRFIREAQAVAKVSHPNVVTIYEVAEHKGRPFFAMEHIEGEPLRQYVARQQLDLLSILDLANQMIAGLQAAHDHGVVHRDIKPANILVEKSGRLRIVDFGLAAMLGAEQITQTGSTLGTIGYMSPEQVRGEAADQRSDLFSFGIVLYELLAGHRPFEADNEAAILYAIVNSTPPPLPAREGVDLTPLQGLVSRLLEKDPARRYADAGTVRQELEAVAAELAHGPPADPAGASIAVLPLSNLSPDPEQEYFCDGIAEDIISDLKQIRNLRVVARTSAFAFKGKNEDIRQIGRQLNVAYVLEGSVRKGGARLRITAQLIEVATGFHVWSERYDRQLEDIFAIQDDISQAIVEKLKLELGENHGGRSRTEAVPIEAYELYSQGRHELNKRTADGFNRARDCFTRCLQLAPDFAEAQTGLADAYFLIFAYDLQSPRDAIARSRVAAQRSLELNNKLADTYATLGGLHTYYDWAWQDAESAFLRALEISPGHTTAHQWYGELLTFLGRRAEAEQHLTVSLQQDPLSVPVLTMFGWHYLRFGNLVAALPHLRKAAELGSGNDFTYICTAQGLMAEGKRSEAWELLDTADRVSEGSAMAITMMGLYASLEGNTEKPEAMYQRLLAKANEEYIPQAYFATLHVALGNEPEAVACLKESIRRHDAELIFMAVMPAYAKRPAQSRDCDLAVGTGSPAGGRLVQGDCLNQIKVAGTNREAGNVLLRNDIAVDIEKLNRQVVRPRLELDIPDIDTPREQAAAAKIGILGNISRDINRRLFEPSPQPAGIEFLFQFVGRQPFGQSA